MKTTQQVTEVTEICIFPYKLNNVTKKIDKKEWGKTPFSITSVTKARRYVASIPGAVAGESGHNQTFSVAIKLVHGFALSEADAWTILSEYNQRCTPAWSERELKHKLDSALNVANHTKPMGHLLGVPAVKASAPLAPPRVLGVISCPIVDVPVASVKKAEMVWQEAVQDSKPIAVPVPAIEEEEMDEWVYGRQNLWKRDMKLNFMPEFYGPIMFGDAPKRSDKNEVTYPSHLPQNPMRHLVHTKVESQALQTADALHRAYNSKEQAIGIAYNSECQVAGNTLQVPDQSIGNTPNLS